MTDEEIERRIGNAYMDGRSDAINEMAERIETAFLHSKFDITDVKPLARQMKEEK